MMQSDMPTLNGNGSEGEPEVGLMATHFGGKAPLSERFRRAQLRAQMFGDPGETLSVGRYKVLARIGSGAMGTVYRAQDPTLDREVAVKVLHRSDEMHRARMTIEAKALAKLSHPNVVTVHEVGTEDGQLFVAMEFVQGRTLQAWLEDPSGPSLIDVFAQAAQGLQAAHDAGIVHRDFKPENVIVGDDGRVRVLDFGMARSPGAPLLGEVEGAAESLQVLEPAITRTGMLAGTPSYMAPEQFEGSRVDARADQFAFCIALHEAIWGCRPFAGETMAELATSVTQGEANLFQGEPRGGLAPDELDDARAVIARGLASDRDGRFPSMGALCERLRTRSNLAVPTHKVPSWKNFLLGLAAFGTCGAAMPFVQDSLRGGGANDAEAVAAAIAPVINVDVINNCGGSVEFSLGPKDNPSLDAETHRLEAGKTETIAISTDEMLWLRNGDGSFGAGVGSSNPDNSFVIGPKCTELFAGPSVAQIDAVRAAARRRAAKDIPRCGLGTELQNGACVPVEWDPRFVDCSKTPCSVDRLIFFGSGGQLSPLLKQMRLVPSIGDDGQQRGFKIFGLRKDTAPRMVGLESGDLLLAINGIRLTATSNDLALALTDEARTANALKIEFERGGEAKTLEVTLRD